MGLIAQALGIGVRGCIEISLSKPAYFAGELVVGHVKLNVTDPIDCSGALVLNVRGKESMKWSEKSGKHEHTRHQSYDFYNIQIPLNYCAQFYNPGEYLFPFEVQLPPTLPGGFLIENRRVLGMRRIRIHCQYSISASTRVKGMLTADLSLTRPLIVHSLPQAHVIQSLQDSTMGQVRLYCCLDRGTCHISGNVEKNVFNIAYDRILVHSTIENNSSRPIRTISLVLYEDLIVRCPHRFERSSSRELARVQAPGVDPNSTTNVTMEMHLVQVLRNAHKVVIPSMEAHFVSISYHVAIICDFSWTPDIELEFPITLYVPVVPVDPMYITPLKLE